MDGNRGIPMMMAVATYDQALAFRPELLSSGGDGVVRSQSVLQLQQSPCSPLWRGSMLVKVQSNSHISRTVFAPVPDPVLVTGRVCSFSYPRHVRTTVFGRDPCRISISGAALLVGPRESKVTAVWRRRRGIAPAITWDSRRHRVSKLLPDNGTMIMRPREIDFPLPGCPFLKGSLHSSTAAKIFSGSACARNTTVYYHPH